MGGGGPGDVGGVGDCGGVGGVWGSGGGGLVAGDARGARAGGVRDAGLVRHVQRLQVAHAVAVGAPTPSLAFELPHSRSRPFQLYAFLFEL